MTTDDDAIRYLSPLLAELAVEYRRAANLGVPRLGLSLRTHLLDAPPSVPPWLTAFVDAAAPEGISDNRDVAQAVQLLGALHATAALPALFRLATRLAADAGPEPLSATPLVFSALWRAFDDLRDHLVEPFLAFVDDEPGPIGRLLVLVAESGVIDERIFSILVSALDAHPGDAATALLVYGDARALPALRARLALLGHEGDATWCRAVACLAHAIEELGGELDAVERRCALTASAQEHAISEVTARHAKAAEATEAAAALALVSHPDAAVRAWIATHSHLEPRYAVARLTQLSRDADPSVRRAVAMARGVPDVLLDALAADPDRAVADAARARREDGASLQVEAGAATPVIIDRCGDTTDPVPSAVLVRLREKGDGEHG